MKLQMMRKFTIILSIGYVVCVGAICGEIYYIQNSRQDESAFWRYQWLIDGMWFMIFSLFFFAVMVLMHPHSKSKLLAHIEELSGDTERVT